MWRPHTSDRPRCGPGTRGRLAPVSVQVHDIGRRRAWAIWLVALAVYVLAVFHRSSLGVAGLLAAERFDINATSLATFTVLQLVVYAAMQVPVGVMLDRFGSRAMLLSGLVADDGRASCSSPSPRPSAARSLARAVLGAGDAMIFVSVIRLVTVWFLVRQAPMVTQLTGLVGQMGAIVAAAPLAFLLDRLGWTRAFALVSSLGIVLLVAVALLVKDSPYRRDEVVQVKLRALAQSVRTLWGNPGTRLGMWSHFTSQFGATVFTLLWGFPFLVQGQGWSEAAASTLLMAMTAWAVLSGLVLARLVGRLPYWRSWIVHRHRRRDGGPLDRRAAVVRAGTDLARGRDGLHHRHRWPRLDGRLRPGPHLHPGARHRPGQRAGQRRRLHRLAAHDGAHRRRPRPRRARGHGRLHPRRLPAALSVQYLFWGLGVVQILRYRRRGLAHLARVHPGATEQMRAGRPFVHPGIGTEGV